MEDSINVYTATKLAQEWFDLKLTYYLKEWMIERFEFCPLSQKFIITGQARGWSDTDDWQHFQRSIPFERDCDGEWIIQEDGIDESEWRDEDLIPLTIPD
jgi:hypothetical protein